MSSQFASGKKAIAECDRCGFRVKLTKLREIYIKDRATNLLVCNTCWEESHPQLMLGEYQVLDPQALQRPRPDNSYLVSGLTVLDTLGEGSRVTQWGWNPVGGGNAITGAYNALMAEGEVGTVTVTVV